MTVCSTYFNTLPEMVHVDINLQAPIILYAGQAFRYSPQNAFYIFN